MSIDIVMGTYNGAAFLEEQIESLRVQTVRDWRLIVRDDGSSDDTVDLLRQASRRDTRVSLVCDDLGNLGFNRNFLHLLALSHAPYVMFCDQDDVWMPQKIELTLKEMLSAQRQNAARPALVHCDARVVDANLCELRSRFIGSRGRRPGMSSVLFANCAQGAASMLNGPLRDEVLKFQPLLPYDWHCALVAQALGTRLFVDEPLLFYRQHSHNAIGTATVKKVPHDLRVSPTLQLSIDASEAVSQTVNFFSNRLSARVTREMTDYYNVLTEKNRLKRLWIALRRRYSFGRRRDSIDFILYVLKILKYP